MEYEFSWVWFVIGLVVVALGAVVLRYYNKFAEATGVGNYTRWQLAGVILICLGFLSALNIPAMIVAWVAQLVLSGGL
jgi:uncharacterized membrane-anchored protein YitT (DUF2179 family)